MFARKGLSVLVAVLFALAAASCGDGDAQETKKPGAERDKACQDGLPFKFGTLPAGFSRELKEGPAPRLDPVKDTVTYHITGPNGKYIEVFRGGQRHKFKKGELVAVLGGPARIDKIDGGMALKIRLARGRCSRYQVEGRSLSETDMRKIAAGIRR